MNATTNTPLLPLPANRLLAAAAAVDRGRATEVRALLDPVRALTWRLIHPRQ